MQTLPDSFLPMFVFGDPATQKAVLSAGLHGQRHALFSISAMRSSARKSSLVSTLFRMPTSAFSSRISSHRMKKVAEWTDYTLKRLGSYYKNLLYEAGLTDHGKTERRYAKPIIDRELEYWMKDNGLQPMYAALTGEN